MMVPTLHSVYQVLSESLKRRVVSALLIDINVMPAFVE